MDFGIVTAKYGDGRHRNVALESLTIMEVGS
jgi:hypothetical protein